MASKNLPLKLFKQDLLYLKVHKKDFTVKKSKYTSQLIFKNDIDELNKHNYSDSRINFSVFHTVKKLKADLHDNLGYFHLFDFSKIKYNALNEFFERDKKVIKVDIKSAYLNFLNKSGFLSEEIYKLILKMEKKDRLICLGMLAYSPDLFHFENGVFSKYEKVKNEYSDIFFYCALQTGVLMEKIKHELGNDFIFFWVDAIYFNYSDKNFKKCTEILEDEGFSYTFDFLENFIYEIKEDGYLFDYFEKDKKKNIFVNTNDFKKKKELDFIKLNVFELKENQFIRLLENLNE